MFEPCYNTPGRIPSPQYTQHVPPILFRKRTEKIDWKRLASIDVNRITKDVDIESLQEILSSVTFCDITNEIDTRYVDNNLIKLFQLAQLLVEYLLYSQDYLTTTIDSLKEENNELHKNCDKLKHQLQEKTNRLTATRRECHRRRLLLMAQQQLMDSGPQSLHKCIYCPKAFVNASFLATHIHRRHPETETTDRNTPVYATQPYLITNNTPYPQVQQSQQIYQQCDDHYTTNNNNMRSSLEHDVRELLNQLKLNPPNLPNKHQSPTRSIGFDGEQNKNNADWHTQLMEEHRRDMELMRKGFEKELHNLQIQYHQTQEELSKLKSRPSLFGLIVNIIYSASNKFQVRTQLHLTWFNQLEIFNIKPLTKLILKPVFRPNRAKSANTTLSQSTKNYNVEQGETSSRHSLPIDDDKQSNTHVSIISGPTTRFLRPPYSLKPQFSDTINHDDKDESEAQQVSRALGRVLTASGGTSPTPSLNASTNMLRYSRLLDQLRGDPETLRKLRHEVEQLLLEQLNEHGIKSDQPHAALRGSTISIPEARLRAENIHKMNSSYKTGLPPPASHSPGSLRRAGTLPLASQRVDITSNLGVSLPILSVNNEIRRSQSTMTGMINSPSKKGTGFSEAKLTPGSSNKLTNPLKPITSYYKSNHSINNSSMQQKNNSPQGVKFTSFKNPNLKTDDEDIFSVSSINGGLAEDNSLSLAQELSPRHSVRVSRSLDPSVAAAHAEMAALGPRPTTRVGGVSRQPITAKHTSIGSPELSNTMVTSLWGTNSKGKLTPGSSNKLTNPLKPITSYYKSNHSINNSSMQQKNNSPQGVKFTSYKNPNLKTDDEDIFSVSSINGGLAEDNSLSLAQELSPRHSVRVSRSLDPSVAAAHAEMAALGPRPTTRVGGVSRQPITAKHTSIGSPELSNTMVTSLWGTNSKAASPITNVISVARSDGAYDEFDSDD
ncbi:zinc finger protein DZIP1 [Schistosoma bovis]|uniref:Zinc finger protein DZIP1 n=2 Tax=Schistosoma TaxID=6181 RepID=A0A430QJC5_SCHBO|nr:zinc finger protein DZIP1 [Schistosoma bovis]